MKKQLLMTLSILGVLIISISCNNKTEVTELKTEKPNILFLFADDQMFNTIGALNGLDVKTPNLDRLVEQGVSFSHTYNQGSFTPAVCVASRTMMVTGAYLWKAASFSKKGNNQKDINAPKSTSNYTIEFNKPEKYWPEYLKEAGYDTYMSGKWHVGEVSPKSIFDVSKHIRPGMPNQVKSRYLRSFDKNSLDTWSPYDSINGGYWKGGKHWSEVLADDGISFIENSKLSTNPFFMYLAFNAPHDPRQAPKEYVDMYPVDSIKVPENFIPEYPYSEAAGAGRGLRDEKLAPFPRTAYSVQVNRKEYFALISHMDTQIGRILDALEASGKANNTYIFFTADHGLAIGDHGFIGKQNMYDSSMRVPMLISGPNIPKGKSVDAFVYLQDVMATTLDIAGLEKPEQVDFNSLLPLAKGETTASAYSTVYGAYFGSQRMYRTDNYKMIVYPTIDIVRLYDMKKDPLEMVDLAEDKQENKELLNRLFTEYQVLQKEMGDPVDITKTFHNFMTNI